MGPNEPACAELFYTEPACQAMFEVFMHGLVTHESTISGVALRDEPTILGELQQWLRFS